MQHCIKEHLTNRKRYFILDIKRVYIGLKKLEYNIFVSFMCCLNF